jgi:hypothetical protein
LNAETKLRLELLGQIVWLEDCFTDVRERLLAQKPIVSTEYSDLKCVLENFSNDFNRCSISEVETESQLKEELLSYARKIYGEIKPCSNKEWSECYSIYNGRIQLWFNTSDDNTHIVQWPANSSILRKTGSASAATSKDRPSAPVQLEVVEKYDG